MTYSIWEQDPPALRFIHDSLHALHRKVDRIMTAQDDINADLQADADALAAVASRVAAVEQGLRDEIATLQAANPGIDVAGLEAHLAELKATADAIDAIPAPTVGAPATPAPEATPPESAPPTEPPPVAPAPAPVDQAAPVATDAASA